MFMLSMYWLGPQDKNRAHITVSNLQRDVLPMYLLSYYENCLRQLSGSADDQILNNLRQRHLVDLNKVSFTSSEVVVDIIPKHLPPSDQ